MIQAAFILLFFGITMHFYFHSVSHKQTRAVGTILLILAFGCFLLYVFDIVGVGLSEQIVKISEKIGEMS